MDVPTIAEKKAKPKRDSKIDPNSFEWLYIQNPIEDNYLFEDGKLTMTASKSSLSENNSPSFLGRRQESPSFYTETEINISSLSEGCKAGLTVYQIQDGHFDLSVKKSNSSLEVLFDYKIKSLEGEKKVKIDSLIEKLKLRVSSDAEKYFFEYSVDDGKNFEKIDEQDIILVSTEVVGGFTGVTIGMFAQGEGKAEFGYFDYTENE